MKRGTEYELLVKSVTEKLIKNDKPNLKNLKVKHMAFYVIDEKLENTYLISNGKGSITLDGKDIDKVKVEKMHLEYTYKDELFTEFSVFGDRLVEVIAKKALTGKIAFCDNKGGVTWVDK